MWGNYITFGGFRDRQFCRFGFLGRPGIPANGMSGGVSFSFSGDRFGERRDGRSLCFSDSALSPGDSMIDPALFTSETAEHYTPPAIVKRVIRLLGEIDLDPCSNLGIPNVPARVHYTKIEDGLAPPWFGRVYMNPPYGREIGSWVGKLVREYIEGDVHSAVTLLPARVDTSWFGMLYGFPICFLRGRLRFLDSLGNLQGSAPFPSMIVYLGTNFERFRSEFQPLGLIYVSGGTISP